MVWAVFLLLRSGTRGGINWTWWQIVGCHKRQSLSWDGWITIRLFVCEERLWSINVITQTSQTSSFDRSTPHLPHPVTSTPPSAAAPDFSRPCRLLTRTLVMIATWQPLPADMCFRLLNKAAKDYNVTLQTAGKPQTPSVLTINELEDAYLLGCYAVSAGEHERLLSNTA